MKLKGAFADGNHISKIVNLLLSIAIALREYEIIGTEIGGERQD